MDEREIMMDEREINDGWKRDKWWMKERWMMDEREINDGWWKRDEL